MRDGFEQNHIPKTFKTIHKTVKSNIEKKASDLKFGTHVSTTKSQGSARHISSLNLVL